MSPPTLLREPVIAYIGLGSNLGDRLANLRRAAILLDAAAFAAPPAASGTPPELRKPLPAPNQTPLKRESLLAPTPRTPKNLVVSSLYESEPVDGPIGQPMYLNAVAQVITRLAARDLLQKLLDLETALGRTRSARNESRIIDLDLLLYGGEQIVEPGLIVPHPGITQRRFVLEPLAELAPDLRHPLLGQTIRQLAILARSSPSQGVRRICNAEWPTAMHCDQALDDQNHLA